MFALSIRHTIVGLTLGLCVAAIGGPADAQIDGPQSAMERLRRGEAAPAQPSYGTGRGAIEPATLQPDPSTSRAPEIGALQSKLGEKDSMIGELRGKLSSQEGLIGNLQSDLGRKQAMI